MKKAGLDISTLKIRFAIKFPEHPLTKILISEPDNLTGEELLAKSQTWLAFFNGDEKDGKK